MDSAFPLAVIAEDDVDLRMLIEIKLRQAGFQVTAVDNGRDAVVEIRRINPDLAVLDVSMPGLSGLDVVAEIRGDEGVRSRILMLSSHSLEDDLDRAYSRGADDYLTKPFSPRELVMRAQALVQRGQ